MHSLQVIDMTRGPKAMTRTRVMTLAVTRLVSEITWLMSYECKSSREYLQKLATRAHLYSLRYHQIAQVLQLQIFVLALTGTRHQHRVSRSWAQPLSPSHESQIFLCLFSLFIMGNHCLWQAQKVMPSYLTQRRDVAYKHSNMVEVGDFFLCHSSTLMSSLVSRTHMDHGDSWFYSPSDAVHRTY